MMVERKLILYIAMSLDGYIAKPNDDIGFLSLVEKENEDYGYADFLKTIDTVIVGRKSFEKVLSMGFDYPHSDKDVYIITRTPKPSIGTFQFYTKDLCELVLRLKKQEGKDIYCDGGAEIVNLLFKYNLIDELYISIIPIILREGISLFNNNLPEMQLDLISFKTYDKGLVQLHYAKK